MDILNNYSVDFSRIEQNKKDSYVTYINEQSKKFYILHEKIYKNLITYRYYFGWLKNIKNRWNNKENLKYRKINEKNTQNP